VRLALLLDRDPTVVSFQHIYNCLKRPDVVDLLVYRACHASPLAEVLDDRIADDIRASTRKFLETYKAIDWHDLHGRLQHFRNRGLVHLTPEQIEKRVSYAEIRSLVQSVTVLAECLMPFDPNHVAVRLDEIDDWSNHAKSVWETVYRTFGKLSDRGPSLIMPAPRRFFAIDRRGTVRLTICVGPWAVKIARNATGRRCNRFEADLWARTTPRRREMLCPVLARLRFDLAVIGPRAQPLSEDEASRLRATDGFPDWDYVPPDEGEPFEYKASDWGRLPDGRLVALDYSAPALD
jgi:hypothetical protein